MGDHPFAIREGLESAAMFQVLSIHREILGTAILLEEAFQAKTTDFAPPDRAEGG